MKKSITLIVALLVISLVASMPEITTDKDVYLLNEQVDITITNNSETNQLQIVSGEDVFKYLGLIDTSLSFIPTKIGVYDIRIMNEFGSLLAYKSFAVAAQTPNIEMPVPVFDNNSYSSNSSNNIIILEKQFYKINENVLIRLNGSVDELRIVNGENVYRYLGLIEETLSFSSREEGEYLIQAFDSDNNEIDSVIFSVVGEAEIIQSRVSIIDQELITSLKVKDSKGKGVFKQVVMKKDNEVVSFVNADIQEKYEMDIFPSVKNVKKIKLEGVDINSNLELQIEEVPDDKIKKYNEKFTGSFAINPLLNFTNGSVSKTAVGTALYKCASWNFSEQICLGEWVKVQDLVPGQEYSIELFSANPAYAEIIVTPKSGGQGRKIMKAHESKSDLAKATVVSYEVNETQTGDPFVELSRFDGEISLKLKYESNEEGFFEEENGKVKWKATNKEVHFYELGENSTNYEVTPKTESVLAESVQGVSNNEMRYFNLGAISLDEMATYYGIAKELGPDSSIMLYTSNEEGFAFYGSREAGRDLNLDRTNLPISRFPTEKKADGCPVIFANGEGVFSIDLYNKRISQDPDYYMDLVKEAYMEAATEEGLEIKSIAGYMYYMDGLIPKIIGRQSVDGDYIKFGFYLESPLGNQEFIDSLRLHLKPLDSFNMIGGLKNLNPEINYSFGENIVEKISEKMGSTLSPSQLSQEEQNRFNELQYKFSKEEWKLFSRGRTADDKIEKFEVELVLNEKPSTNVFQYSIESENLEFYYQDELTEEELESGTYRKEKFVGSYAVYSQGQKVFHIYRPMIIDAQNNSVWGQMHIDEENGTLSITVPQDFLDNAVYPIKIDPTFGYTGQGGTQTSLIDTIRGSEFTLPNPAILNFIEAYITAGKDTTGVFTFALYDSSNNLVASTSQGSASGDALGSISGWYNEDVSGTVVVPPGDYKIVAWGDRTVGSNEVDIHHDTGSAGQGQSQSLSYTGSYPSTLSPSTNSNEHSIFLDYTTVTTSVSLSSPADTDTLDYLNITFNYVPTSNAPFLNCSLWDNSTGMWQTNQSNSSAVINGSTNSFNKIYASDGTFKWNVECCNGGECEFASSNRTFTIDTTYPQFSDFWDDNATLIGSGTGHFNVTVENTNGSVLLEINGVNVTASNLTSNVYNVSYYFSSSGNYTYRWHSWGNGSQNNYNVSVDRVYTVNATPDFIYPSFSAFWDDNGTLIDSGTGHFNVTVDNTNGTVLLEINGENVTATNLTSNVYNASYTFTIGGNYTYKWHSWGNGTRNNYNVSEDRVYTINATMAYPEIDFVYPTPDNDSNQTSATVIINVSHTADYTDTIILFWNGTLNESRSYSGDYTNFTLAGLDNGVYSYYVWLNNSYGNTDQTETRIVTIDNTEPSITLQSPGDDSWSTNSDVTFTYSVTDNIIGVNNCSLIIDDEINKTNSTITEGISQNFVSSLTSSMGYDWSINCTDKLGNTNSSETRIIKVDLTDPTISDETINGTTFEINEQICLNVSVTDTYSGTKTVTARIDYPISGLVDRSLSNSTSSCGGGGNYWSYTLTNNEAGQYNWTQTIATDVAGNQNITVTASELTWDVTATQSMTANMTSPIADIKINESEYNNNYTQSCTVECTSSSCENIFLFAQYNNGTWNDITTSTTQLISTVDNASCGNLTDGNWWNESWLKRKEINITYNGASTLTNFPIYINITKETEMLANYNDLRIISGPCLSEGGTELSYEIENYTANNAHVWVKIPSMTGDTQVCVYYNNSGASNGQDMTGVWNSDFLTVQHLQESGGTHYDSTSYGINGTDTGSPQSSAGMIDGANYFSADNDSIDLGDSSILDISSEVTVEAWINNEFSSSTTSLSAEGSITHSGGKFDSITPSIADVDGDGDMEIIAVDGNTGVLAVYSHDGSSLSVEASTGALGKVKSSPVVVDVDDDGDLEIIFGDNVDTLYVYSHTGSSLTQEDTISIGKIDKSSVAVADLDDDGDLEFAIADGNTGILSVYSHDGSTISQEAATGALDKTKMSPAIVDIDTDGTLEIIVVDGNDGDIFIYNHDGDTLNLEDSDSTPDKLDVGSVAVADLDEDGDLEFVMGDGNTGILSVYSHSGTTITQEAATSALGKIKGTPVVGDLDNDGTLEIVVVDSVDGTMFVFNHDGTTLNQEATIETGGKLDGGSPVLADLDNDGTLEIVFVDATDGTLAVYRHNGASLTLETSASPGQLMKSGVAVGDTDGDGQLEIVAVGNSDGTIYVYGTNSKSTATWPQVGLNLENTHYQAYPYVVASKKDAYGIYSGTSSVMGVINGRVINASLSSGWHHVAMTYNGTMQSLYVDGELKNSNAFTDSINTNSNNLTIGTHFNGTIDEVRISNTSKSAEWINYTYQTVVNQGILVEAGTDRSPGEGYEYSCSASFNITSGVDSGNNTWPIRCTATSFNTPNAYSSDVNLTINDHPTASFYYPTNNTWLSTTENLNASSSTDDFNITLYSFELDNNAAFSSPTVLCSSADENCTFDTTTQTQCAEESMNCYLRLNVTDSDGLTNSTYITIGIDNTGPIAVLTRPLNFTNISSNYYMVNASVSDIGSGIDTVTFLYRQNNTTSWNIACNDTDGTYPYSCTWDLTSLEDYDTYEVRVYANDSEGNIGANNTNYNITVDRLGPTINLESPDDDVWSSNEVVFRYNATDLFSTISSCSLIINGTINQTNSTITESVSQNFSLNNMAGGSYAWNVNCTDSLGNTNSSETRILKIDTISPSVSLDRPEDNLVNDTSQYVNLTFNATVTDNSNLYNCSLWHNISGTWKLNQTETVSGMANTTNFTLTQLENISFIWNIQCYDLYGNSNWSETNRSVILNWTDIEYPVFSDFWDDNATLIDTGTGHFNVTVNNTNGSVLLEINGVNVTATNLTSNVYNASYTFTIGGNYTYRWHSWGNGTRNNYNVSEDRVYKVNATDSIVPVFSDLWDDNGTIIESGTAHFNVTVNNTNGTVLLEINGQNITATNISGVYNVSYYFSSPGDYTYKWHSWGNGPRENHDVSEDRVYTVKPDLEYPVFSDFWDDNGTLVEFGMGHFNVTVNSTNGIVLLEINGVNVTATNLTSNVYNASYYFSSPGNYTYKWHSWGNGTLNNYNVSEDRVYTVKPDLEYPVFSDFWDDNGTLVDSGVGNFNVTVNSTNGIVLLEINGVNVTATNLTSNVYNASYYFSSPGNYTYKWHSWGNGSQNNYNVSENRTYTVLVIPPITVDFISPTPDNNSNQTSTTIVINVSHTSTNTDTIILYWNGSLNESRSYSGNYTNFTLTGLENGVFTYYVWLNNSYGFTNQTETRTITIDNTEPSITLQTPENNTWSTDTNKLFTYTTTDNVIGVNNCSFILDGEVNQTNSTITEGISQNFTIYGMTSRSYNWSINCTDKLGNTNSSETRIIKVDLTDPTISDETINGTTFEINEQICLNVSVTDTYSGTKTVTARIDYPVSGLVDILLSNSTSSCGGGGSYWSYTLTNNEAGQFNWTHTIAVDVAGNTNTTVTASELTWNVTSTQHMHANMTDPISNIKINESEYNNNYTQSCTVECTTTRCEDVTLFAQYNNGTWNDITTSTTQLISSVNNASCGDLIDSLWWNESWLKRKEINITYVGSTMLTDFPAYLNISKETEMLANFNDLRIISGACLSSGGTELAYEIENYTATNAHVWVKIPSITGDTQVCIYYNNSGASSGENPTGVWDGNYSIVW
ncbi:DUF2341 domain-containing protein, partial [Bacteroidota bacterium]